MIVTTRTGTALARTARTAAAAFGAQPRAAAAAAGVIAVMAALPVAAQTVAFGGVKADTRAPVELTADRLSVDQASGQATFAGNVLIGQGQMRLKADTVTVTYAPGGQQKIRSFKATGHVTLVSGPDAAEAAEAVYEVDSGQVTLRGDALVSQGKNVMAGDEVRVNLSDGTAEVSGRVRTVIQPGGN